MKTQKTAKMAVEAILKSIHDHLEKSPIAGEYRIANGEVFVGIVKKIEMYDRAMTLTFLWTQRVRESNEIGFEKMPVYDYVRCGRLLQREIPISFIPEEILYTKRGPVIHSILGEKYLLSTRSEELRRVLELNPPKSPVQTEALAEKAPL